MNFRRWILALPVLALSVAGANAQIVNSGSGSGAGAFTCNAINGAVTPTLRAEGITELVGDIVIQCQGGTNFSTSAAIPQANITVFVNTQVTSRLIASGNVSEALLIIDEPNTTNPGPGPAAAITLCGTPASGCLEYVGPAGTPLASVGGGPGANVFSGVLNADGRSVTFFGVPIMPPVTSGYIRQFRITNIRANATAVPAGANTPGNVQALISISGSSFVPLQNSQLVVGYVIPGLITSIRKSTDLSGGSAVTFNQCDSPGPGAAPDLRYTSTFGTAFKTRVNASSSTGGAQNGSTAIQNIPGSANNSTSESGFILNGAAYSNGVSGNSPTPSTNGAVVGLADFGTRFKAVFNNIPAGVSVYVSTTNLSAAGTPATSGSTSYAQLVVSETASESSNTAPTLSATGSTGTPGISYVALTPAAGTNSVTAVWEVINSNTSQIQNFDFATYIAYTSKLSTATPTAPSAMTVNMSFAPISTTFTASSSAPIPRFIDLGTGDNLGWANIQVCTSSLLFPYVTTVTGFETGVAIANTTMDPYGTGNQSGTCNLYWYGNNNGGTTNTPIPLTTTSTINPGTVWTGQASATTNAGPGFTGYMIATCNFQYAHGSAFITDVGSRGILAAYLALVTGRGGFAIKESLMH